MSGGFTVRGLRNGSMVEITWEAGDVRGDPTTVDLIETEAEMVAAYRAEPALAASQADFYRKLPDEPLAEAGAAYLLITSQFDRVHDVSGDVPVVAEGPEA